MSSSTTDPKPVGIAEETCEKCGSTYNAAIPEPHVCGPIAVPVGISVVAPKSAGNQPDGVNYTTCAECGATYNACLPGGHVCLRKLSGKSDDDAVELTAEDMEKILKV